MGNQFSSVPVETLPEEVLRWGATKFLNAQDVAVCRQVSPTWMNFCDQNIPVDIELSNLSYSTFLTEHSNSKLGKLSIRNYIHDTVPSARLDTVRQLHVSPLVNSIALHHVLERAVNLRELTIKSQPWPFVNFYTALNNPQRFQPLPAFSSRLQKLQVEIPIPHTFVDRLEYLGFWSFILGQDAEHLQELNLSGRSARNELFLTSHAMFSFLARALRCNKLRIVETGYDNQLGGQDLKIHQNSRRQVSDGMLQQLVTLKLGEVSVTAFANDLQIWYRIFIQQRSLERLVVRVYSKSTADGFTILFLKMIVENNFRTLSTLCLELLEDFPAQLSCEIFAKMTQLKNVGLTCISGETVIDITHLHRLPSALECISLHGFNVDNVALRLLLHSLPNVEEFSVLNKSIVINAGVFAKLLRKTSLRILRIQPFDDLNYNSQTLFEEIAAILEEAPTFTPLVFAVGRHRHGLDGFAEGRQFLLDTL